MPPDEETEPQYYPFHNPSPDWTYEELVEACINQHDYQRWIKSVRQEMLRGFLRQYPVRFIIIKGANNGTGAEWNGLTDFVPPADGDSYDALLASASDRKFTDSVPLTEGDRCWRLDKSGFHEIRLDEYNEFIDGSKEFHDWAKHVELVVTIYSFPTGYRFMIRESINTRFSTIREERIYRDIHGKIQFQDY